jgi:hypothetical protein
LVSFSMKAEGQMEKGKHSDGSGTTVTIQIRGRVGLHWLSTRKDVRLWLEIWNGFGLIS